MEGILGLIAGILLTVFEIKLKPLRNDFVLWLWTVKISNENFKNIYNYNLIL